MPPLSPELLKQIETEAKNFADKTFPLFGDSAFNWEKVYNGYISGATTYAHYKEEAERYRKALEAIQKLPWELNGSWADGIATKALNPPAGDNTKTEKDGK